MMSMLKLLLVLCIASIYLIPALGQSVFTDERDGRVYQVVDVEGVKIFGENLMYAAPGSYILDEKGKDLCDKGNYYAIQGIDDVCPSGSHLITEDEWAKYFEYLLRQIGMTTTQMQKSYTSDGNTFVLLRDTTESLDIFDQSSLGLRALGWVQGKKIKNTTSLALWVKSKDDDRMHLHIGPDGFMRHAHDHHIYDKPRKNRRFNVRCVLD